MEPSTLTSKKTPMDKVSVQINKTLLRENKKLKEETTKLRKENLVKDQNSEKIRLRFDLLKETK